MPQIEVTFDIDANGIVHVSAKDLGTGKEQSIQITASSGLSEAEIKRMVQEAEAHAEEDKKKRAEVEVRIQLDQVVYRSEKTLAEAPAETDATAKAQLQTAIDAAKQALESGDADKMQAARSELEQASHKFAEAIYAQANAAKAGAAQADGGTTDGASGGGASGAGAQGGRGDDAVDADFEEVKE
jgi:molecular chaperone DnaK